MSERSNSGASQGLAWLAETLKCSLGGLLIMTCGGYAIWEGSRYSLGTLTAMGPGFLPVVVGVLLICLGLAVVFESFVVPSVEFDRSGLASVRAAAAIFGGLLAFAIIVGRYGVVPATFALVLINAFVRPQPKLFTALLLASCLSVVAVVVFIQGFGLSMRAFRW